MYIVESLRVWISHDYSYLILYFLYTLVVLPRETLEIGIPNTYSNFKTVSEAYDKKNKQNQILLTFGVKIGVVETVSKINGDHIVKNMNKSDTNDMSNVSEAGPSFTAQKPKASRQRENEDFFHERKKRKLESGTDPIDSIRRIGQEIKAFISIVENFQGSKVDKSHFQLLENGNELLLKLDKIEPQGRKNLQDSRKKYIDIVQKVISKLEGNN